MQGQQENQSHQHSAVVPGFMGIGNLVFQSLHSSTQSAAVKEKLSSFLAIRDELLKGVKNLISKTDPRINIGLSAWLDQNAKTYPGAILKKLISEYAAAKAEDARFSILKKAGDWATYCAHLGAIIETYSAQMLLDAAEELILAWSKLHAESNVSAEALKTAQGKVEILTADNQALREEVAGKAAAAREKDALAAQLASQNEQVLKDLKAEVERLRQLADKTTALEQEVVSLKRQLDSSESQVLKLEQEKSEYKAKAEANAQMQTELAVTKALLEQHRQRIAELEKQIAEDRQETKEMQSQMLAQLTSLNDRSRLDATANPYASTSMNLGSSFVGSENAFGGRAPAPRDLNTSMGGNGNRGKSGMFAAPAQLMLLRNPHLAKSVNETTEPNASKIATGLHKLRSTRLISELRISMFELLARFLSHFDPDDQRADECIAAINAYKGLFLEPLDPKTALDRLIRDLSEVKCSTQGPDQFEALKQDLSQLARTTPRAVQSVVPENLNNILVIAELKNLTMQTRFNIPTLNEYFTEVYEEAEAKVKAAKTATKTAVAPKTASKHEEQVFGATQVEEQVFGADPASQDLYASSASKDNVFG